MAEVQPTCYCLEVASVQLTSGGVRLLGADALVDLGLLGGVRLVLLGPYTRLECKTNQAGATVSPVSGSTRVSPNSLGWNFLDDIQICGAATVHMHLGKNATPTTLDVTRGRPSAAASSLPGMRSTRHSTFQSRSHSLWPFGSHRKSLRHLLEHCPSLCEIGVPLIFTPQKEYLELPKQPFRRFPTISTKGASATTCKKDGCGSQW